MKALPKRLILVNSLGALGYLFIWVGYTLVLALLIVVLFSGSTVEQAPVVVESGGSGGDDASSPLLLIFASILAFIMAIVTLFIFITIPYFVGKLSSRVLYKTAQVLKIAPTLKNMFFLKCAVAAKVVVIFLVISLFSSVATSTRNALTVTVLIVCGCAIVMFLLQWVLARGRSFKPW